MIINPSNLNDYHNFHFTNKSIEDRGLPTKLKERDYLPINFRCGKTVQISWETRKSASRSFHPFLILA